MQRVRVANRSRDTVLGDRVGVADRWCLRLRGLLGRRELARGEGLLLRPCRAVHLFGMTGPLDVAFLDHEGRVVAQYAPLRPWRATRLYRRAVAALELPPGMLEETGTRIGDTLSMIDHRS